MIDFYFNNMDIKQLNYFEEYFSVQNSIGCSDKNVVFIKLNYGLTREIQ